MHVSYNMHFWKQYHRREGRHSPVVRASGAESCRKVVRSNPDFAIQIPITGKLCQPSSKWVPFSNQGRIRKLKERDGLPLLSAVPKI